MTNELESWIGEGRRLYQEEDPEHAQDAFNTWADAVGWWLTQVAPGTGISADWSALPVSNLTCGRHYLSDPTSWLDYKKAIQTRLSFLGKVSRQLVVESVAPSQEKASLSQNTSSGKVFIVHGHDSSRRDSVARFLHQLHLNPIVLHEQPNAGRTIIEKFIDHSNVGYAVVLFTPDDVGRLKNDPVDKEQPRARQNVILELGFFLGKLGRKNVCVLYEAGVDIPSDYRGVLFVELDSQAAWQMKLAKEMKAAGVPIDMNAVLS